MPSNSLNPTGCTHTYTHANTNTKQISNIGASFFGTANDAFLIVWYFANNML